MRFAIGRLLPALWLISTLVMAGAIAIALHQPPAEGAVFVATIQGRRQLMLADLSRGLRVSLPPHDGDAFQPAVSPDLSDVIFAAYHDGDSELYRLRLGSGEAEQLTANNTDDLHPQWSPDGGRIVYQAELAEISQVYILHLKSGDRRQLTGGDIGVANPHWSPAGDRLAFDSAGEIYMFDIDSGQRRALTDDDYWDAHPVWSPDGALIVYDSFRDGSWNLYSVDTATREIRPLTPAGRDEQHATFTRRAGQIAYQSVTRFTGSLFLLDLQDPSRQRARDIPPDIGAPLHLVFGGRSALKPSWSDILEPHWLR